MIRGFILGVLVCLIASALGWARIGALLDTAQAYAESAVSRVVR